MKKLSIALLVTALGLILSAAAFCADMAKEGSGMYRAGKSGTFEVMMMEEGQLQMNYDETGVLVKARKTARLPMHPFGFSAPFLPLIKNSREPAPSFSPVPTATRYSELSPMKGCWVSDPPAGSSN